MNQRSFFSASLLAIIIMLGVGVNGQLHSASDLPAPLLLSGPWRLAGKDAPPRRLPELVRWAQSPEFIDFSGTAAYSCEFQLSPVCLAGSTSLELDLGEVRDIAEVPENGVSAGTLWKHPYKVRINAPLMAGRNELEIKVTNRLINRMWVTADLLSPYPMLVDRVRESVASGLIGPVFLRPTGKLLLRCFHDTP